MISILKKTLIQTDKNLHHFEILNGTNQKKKILIKKNHFYCKLLKFQLYLSNIGHVAYCSITRLQIPNIQVLISYKTQSTLNLTGHGK